MDGLTHRKEHVLRKRVVIEELHVTILVPVDLPPKAIRAIRRIIRRGTLDTIIKESVESFCQRNSALAAARVKVSR